MTEKQNFFNKLRQGLSKTRNSFLANVFSAGRKVDAAFYEELEEALIVADVGMKTTEAILDRLKKTLESLKIREIDDAREKLISILTDIMRPGDEFLAGAESAALLIVGVNGVGKTTSIGKLAHYFVEIGRKPLIAAADTFRAASAEQLAIWAQRSGVPIVKHMEGADPAAVVFDAIASFKAKGGNVLLCDTAGRLHNKKNLMDELGKIKRIIERELPDARFEVLLVLDATTGQNAIAQAKVFSEYSGLTGIILTKLDGTAKGGVAVAVREELGLPVRFAGVGEGIDDLQPFDPDAFAKALV